MEGLPRPALHELADNAQKSKTAAALKPHTFAFTPLKARPAKVAPQSEDFPASSPVAAAAAASMYRIACRLVRHP
jgi:hypothetical protein